MVILTVCNRVEENKHNLLALLQELDLDGVFVDLRCDVGVYLDAQFLEDQESSPNTIKQTQDTDRLTGLWWDGRVDRRGVLDTVDRETQNV